LKKLLIASAVSASLLTSAVAHAETASILDNWEQNAYAQVKVGMTDMGLSDDATTVTGVVGLNTPSIHPMLSFEADLTFTVADAESAYPSSIGTTTVEASAFSIGGYAVANFNQLGIENLTPFARIGLAYTSVDVTASNSYASASGDDSEFDLGLGAGLRYQMTDQFSAMVDYSTVSELDTLNLGVQFTF